MDEPTITGVTVSITQMVEIVFYPKDSSVEIFTRPFNSQDNTSRRSKYLKRQKIFKVSRNHLYYKDKDIIILYRI